MIDMPINHPAYSFVIKKIQKVFRLIQNLRKINTNFDKILIEKCVKFFC